jgi:hypothetical protein
VGRRLLGRHDGDGRSVHECRPLLLPSAEHQQHFQREQLRVRGGRDGPSSRKVVGSNENPQDPGDRDGCGWPGLWLAWVVVGLGCGSGDDTEEFCKIATTSTQKRTEPQINAYYDQLKKVAPKELVGDITTLRSKWMSVSFSLEDLVSGEVSKVCRPPEGSKATKNVKRIVLQKCKIDGGVYVVSPESGL